MYEPITPPVIPPNCSHNCKFFRLREKWRLFATVHSQQARQMIAKSKTLRMVGQGHLTELYTCVTPLTKFRRQRRKHK